MQTANSTLYGRIPAPENFAELHSLCEEPLPDEHFNVRIWRGQADASWPLHSAAYRRLLIDQETVSESDVQMYESSLLELASHKGFRRVDGRDLSDLELLARLQHHGAATRLVDATRSALVALFFTVIAQPNQPGILLGIHSSALGGYEGLLDQRPYDEIFKSLPKEHAQTWEPPGVSPRIAAQRAQFLYSPVISDMKASVALAADDKHILVIHVSPQLKKICLKILSEVYDIRYASLFPDIDGFGYANSFRFSRSGQFRW
jgi:hypothetical protein